MGTSALTFQDMILALEHYWADKGCTVMQPYDSEVGAGTFHTATLLRSLGPDAWRTCYPQPCRRPADGRYGDNPNRMQHYYQFQVVLKPCPEDSQDLYLGSLAAIGLDPAEHDVRFVEDDWESPTLGAWGLGWEVWMDGMEVTQYTYFQQVGGIEVDPVPVEITYGLERIAMYAQGKNSVYDIVWSYLPDGSRRCRRRSSCPGHTWQELRLRHRLELSAGWHANDLRRRVPRERGRVLGLQLRGRQRRHDEEQVR